jgi:hypothetical protein
MTTKDVSQGIRDLLQLVNDQRAEIADLKTSVVAFCAPWAAQYAEMFGLPAGHLHPTHYDILAKCGARMDDFTRADLT